METILKTLMVVFIFWFCSCREELKTIPTDHELVIAWVDLTTYITRNTPANSPTFSSRAFGYIGLTMYESVVGGDRPHQVR